MKAYQFVGLLLVCLLGSQSLFAQSIGKLERQAKKIKAKEGLRSAAYAKQLLELVKACQQAKKWDQTQEALELADESFDGLYQSNFSINNLDRYRLHLIYCVRWWDFLTREGDFKAGVSRLKQEDFFEHAAYLNESQPMIKVYRDLAKAKGSTSSIFINLWMNVYAQLTRKNSESVIGELWQFLKDHRKEEFGTDSRDYTCIVYAYSSFLERTGRTQSTIYKNLKEEVDAYYYYVPSVFINQSPRGNFPPPPPPVSEKEKTQEEVEEGEPTREEILKESEEPRLPPPPPPVSYEEKEEEETTPPEGLIYTIVEEMPRFPAPKCEAEADLRDKKSCADQALLQFIYKNIRYPSFARENGIEGMAVVSFTVMEYGTIEDVKVLRNPGGGTGAEAKRVVLMMREMPMHWHPGRQRGKNVRVKYNLPVRYKLN